MSGALDDIVVLDVTRNFASSMAAAFLADFGARVIRLESLAGDARATVSGADAPLPGAWNHEADLIHRNKQSIALDPVPNAVARCWPTWLRAAT